MGLLLFFTFCNFLMVNWLEPLVTCNASVSEFRINVLIEFCLLTRLSSFINKGFSFKISFRVKALLKYGIRDYRGGGRQSARETASRVAAGAIAKVVLNKLIGKKFKVVGGVVQLGLLGCNKKNWNEKEIRKNPFFCPDKKAVKLWEKYLLAVRKAGSSCGAVIELRASGVPVGLGAPIYSKLDSDLASALMSINAVKGVNIGAGMSSAFLSGEENSDEIRSVGGKIKFISNNAGGILGGISSGQEIVASFAVKPTSSILSNRKTIDKKGKNTKISVKGRHDPCVGIRAVPIGEAMMSCVLLDHYLLNRAQRG